MSLKIQPMTMLVSRLLLALIFVLSGLAKIGAIDAMQGYMELLHISGVLIYPTIIFEVVGGLLIVVGYRTRIVAALLAGFSIVTAIIFHSQFADPAQMTNFLKNVSIAGGLLLLASVGAGRISIDEKISIE